MQQRRPFLYHEQHFNTPHFPGLLSVRPGLEVLLVEAEAKLAAVFVEGVAECGRPTEEDRHPSLFVLLDLREELQRKK